MSKFFMKRKYFIFLLLIFVLAGFLTLPSNRYLFNALIYLKPNIDDYEIFSNRIIKSGECQPWNIAINYNKKPIPERFRKISSYLKTIAFIVIKDTSIIHETYYKGYNDTSYSNSFSIAKSIISLLIGCAIDEGLIKNPDEPVGDFLPEFKSATNNKLTIKYLLTMSSGLNWNESYNSLFSVTTKSYYGNDLKALVHELRVVNEPGKQFKYLSGNTLVLATILEKATGKKISNYASEKLWIPMGACSNALWSIDKKGGEEKAYCCFNTTARDFARIGQLILNKGMWKGKRIVSAKFINESISPASWLIDERGKKKLDYYGYHWWLMSFRGQKVIYARGILGQYILILPDKNMVIVRLGEKRCSLKTDNKPADIYIWLNMAMELV
jgi:CubicO group peptidase (beta-lactamase class C family)